MDTLPTIPPTIEAAEAEGWQGINVTCDCKMVVFHFDALRRDTRERRLFPILERMRCQKCRSQPKFAELYRSRIVALGASKQQTLQIWPVMPEGPCGLPP